MARTKNPASSIGWTFAPISPQANSAPLSTYHTPAESTSGLANNSPQAMRETLPKRQTPAESLLYSIRHLSELLDDLEKMRIANGNRIAAMERDTGEALPHLFVIQESVRAIEHQAELELVRAWRKYPLSAVTAAIPGLGEKTMARLIAETGDPADRPNVAKLWAYCGHGDPKRSERHEGMTQAELFARGNPGAKKRVYLAAVAAMKRAGKQGERSPYRDVYDAAREKYADAIHAKPCPQCGPSGHPALPGSPLSEGHKHARALRAVGKAILVDLWVEARRLRGLSVTPKRGAGHSFDDLQLLHARTTKFAGPRIARNPEEPRPADLHTRKEDDR